MPQPRPITAHESRAGFSFNLFLSAQQLKRKVKEKHQITENCMYVVQISKNVLQAYCSKQIHINVHMLKRI